MTSPPSFKPFAAACMALATELNRKDKNTIPTYDDYLDAVKFAQSSLHCHDQMTSTLFQPDPTVSTEESSTKRETKSQQNTTCMSTITYMPK
jgi:hypothetical protein